MTSMLGGPPTYDQRKNIFEDDTSPDFLAGGMTGKANVNEFLPP